MAILVAILITIFVFATIVSFVLSARIDKLRKAKKEEWFSSHSEDECNIVKDYINFINAKQVKVNKRNGRIK